MTRASYIAAAALLATLTGCSSAPPPSFPPLDYSYLHPIVLKVANLSVVNNYTPGPDAQPVLANDPVSPPDTLLNMLQHRLVASGDPGNGTVQMASLTEANGNISGTMTVDLNLSSPDGRSTGFTEASVSATEQAPDDLSSPDGQTALYHLTKHLMDLMNVQLPYQIRHSLQSWVSYTNVQSLAPASAGGVSTGAPASAGGVSTGNGIQAAPLAAPGAVSGAAPPATPIGTAPVPPAAPGPPPTGVLGVLPVTGTNQ